jgi:hypothetical protein
MLTPLHPTARDKMQQRPLDILIAEREIAGMGLNLDCLMKTGLPISGFSSFVEMLRFRDIASSFDSNGGAAA